MERIGARYQDDTRPVTHKAKPKPPADLRIVHAVYYRAPTWYCCRIVLDGQGREVGRSEHPTIDIRTAADLCQQDAIKLGARIYRTIGPLEAQAVRLAHELEAAKEEAETDRANAGKLADKAARLRSQEREMRKRAETMPRRAELPQKPANLPAHLAMRWEDKRSREDEEAGADALARMAEQAEYDAANVAASVEAKLAALEDTRDVQAAWASVHATWQRVAPDYVNFVWGIVIAAFAFGLGIGGA
jgi:hypothetical protein